MPTTIPSTNTTLSRSRQLGRRILIGIAVLALALVFGGRWYLGSQHAKRIAAERIGNLLGMNVEVEGLQIGTSETEVKLRILNTPTTPGDVPAEIFSVKSIKADISLIDLLSGNTQPKEVVLKGVAVTLTFDRDGRLLTTLPQPTGPPGNTVWPRIRIEEAALTLRTENRPDFHLEHVQLTGEYLDNQYQLSGTIKDPKWSEWTLAGSFARETGTGWLELKTLDGPLDAALIRSIPPVPESMWGHVQTAGRSAASIRLELGEANVFHYSVLLQPASRAQVTLTDLDVPLTQVEGDIRISGKQVTLKKCRGKVAEGTVDINGLLDFEPATAKLTLNVKAAALDVTKLPAEWSLPQQITGKLRGEAKLELLIPPDGKLQPRGGGSATIDDARIAGLPAEIKLRLRGDGRRYRFESDMAAVPRAEMLMSVAYYPAAPPIPPAALPEKPTTLETSITFRDVNIIELLRQFEIEIPYKLGGKVTLKVVATVPVGGVADRQAYRFRGTLTSPAFHFEGLEVRDVQANLDYHDGVLSLRELKATVAAEDGTPGRIQGSARAEIEPRNDLTASLSISDLPVRQVLKAVPGFASPVDGRLDGRAEFRAALNQIQDNSTWKANVTLNAKALTVGNTVIGKVEAKADLEKGVAKLTALKAEVFHGTVTGTAEMPLRDAKPGRIEMKFADIDSAAAIKLLPTFPVPLTGRVTGQLKATAKAAEKDAQRSFDATLDLSAPKMTVQGIPAERLTGKVKLDNGIAAYELEGHSLGGTFDVKGHYPAKPAENDRSQVHLRNFDLARLAPAFRVTELKSLRGRFNAHFEFEPDGSMGIGRVSVDEVRWGQQTLSNGWNGTLMLHNGTLDLRDFGGDIAGGRLRLRTRYDFDDPRRNYYALTIERASLRKLAVLIPGGLDSIQGDATVEVRGRLGPQAGGTLTLTLASGTLGGLPLTEVRIPIEWTGTLGTGRIALREGTARLGQGKLTANISLDYGLTGRVAGAILFDRVPLRSLIGTTASTFGNGRLSGRFDLGGTAIRSLDDVTGTLNATLNQASVREVPLISVVTPFLQPFGFLQPFDSGEVKGRLAKGVFRIERFSLSNPAAQVYAEGTVTRLGRVDLDVIAVTGQIGPNTRALRLFGVNLPAIGPLPLAVVTRVSDTLSNRMIRLTVSGTVGAPDVQINRAALLTDTAVRFFLGQYLLPATLAESR